MISHFKGGGRMIDIEQFKNPVKREDLPRVFGCSDRKARKEIEMLQEKYNIINLQDGRGYFLADDVTARKYAKQEMRRAISTFQKARRILKRCKENPDQIEIEV